MPDRSDRVATNIAGKFYVDTSCIDCDLCRTIAPEVFRRDDEAGLSIVYQQPSTPDEVTRAGEAIDSCPVNAIGDDGEAE